jgi:hypothetical protein
VKVFVEGLILQRDVLFVMAALSLTETFFLVNRGSEKVKYDLQVLFPQPVRTGDQVL